MFSVDVMYDLLDDSDISARRRISSMYDEVIFISIDRGVLSARAKTFSWKVANNSLYLTYQIIGYL